MSCTRRLHMIIERLEVGRYIFIFDLNADQDDKLYPFDGKKYYEADWDSGFDIDPNGMYVIDTANVRLYKSVKPLWEWLNYNTKAFRVYIACVRGDVAHYAVTAFLFEVPSTLAPLFKLFWY